VIVLHEVLGLGRSGTTVVGRLVARISGAIPVDELVMVWRRGFLEDRPCTCGERFSACPRWKEVCAAGDGLLTRVTAERVDAHIRALAPPRVTARALTQAGRRSIVAETPTAFLDAHAALVQSIAAVTGADALAASSKSPPLVLLLAKVPGLDVRALHVVRDARAVAWSWEHPHTPGPDEAPLPSTSAVRAAGAWVLVNRAADAVGRALGGAPLVRLEDLAGDPRALEEAVAVREAAHPGAIDSGQVHTLAGNPGVRRSIGEPTVRLDERWRREDTATRTLVTALTAPLLWRYGYLGAAR
jgi:hypothetical protein